MSGLLGHGVEDWSNQKMPGESKGLSGCENQEPGTLPANKLAQEGIEMCCFITKSLTK